MIRHRFALYALLLTPIALWPCVVCRTATADWQSAATDYSSGEQLASHSDRTVYRQCRAAFFSKEVSAWFEVECLVPADQAQPGVFALCRIPGMGDRKMWIVEVYLRPKVSPPKGLAQLDPAHPDNDFARIVMTVPEGIKLRVNDLAVDVGPGRHEVVVPGLAAGVVYQYRFEVSRAGGSVPRRQRTVYFSAGDTVQVDFTAPAVESTVSK